VAGALLWKGWNQYIFPDSSCNASRVSSLVFLKSLYHSTYAAYHGKLHIVRYDMFLCRFICFSTFPRISHIYIPSTTLNWESYHSGAYTWSSISVLYMFQLSDLKYMFYLASRTLIFSHIPYPCMYCGKTCQDLVIAVKYAHIYCRNILCIVDRAGDVSWVSYARIFSPI
jgi:hypothetical protein